MYRRSTRNKILISTLLLIATLFISGNKTGYADTDIMADIFMPFGLIAVKPSMEPAHTPTLPPDTPDLPTVSTAAPLNTPEPTPTATPLPTFTPTPTPLPTEPPEETTNKKVYIYHTHTNEAYLKSEADRNINLAGRSDDATITVKAAGEALKDKLVSLGIDTVHDKTNNEASGYSSAYKTSYVTVDKAIEAHGEFDVYLDVHRDAFISGTTPTVSIDGIEVARIMLVVGGKSNRADKNHEFAKKLMSELNKIHPKLCEKVLYVESSAYNKIDADKCLIVEVGDNNVTAEEAKRAAEYVALATAKILNG